MPLTREQIRETTKGKIPRPANYRYGTKLPEWELAETTLSRDQFIRQVQPMHDRIVVQLLNETRPGAIVLTDAKPLIGGCRKARVLKTGPGRWIPGEWWKLHSDKYVFKKEWQWIPGYRRPVSVQAGQVVLIGNWVDLEVEDIALCQEGDIRVALA
jgi:co-chaperonin GroES (HSP10)